LYYDQTTLLPATKFLSVRLTWTPASSGDVTSERLQFKSSNNYNGHVIGEWYDILTTGGIKDYVAPLPSAAAGGKRSSLVTFGWYNSQVGQIHQFRVGSVYNNNNAQTVWSEPLSWRNKRYDEAVLPPPPPTPTTPPPAPPAAPTLGAGNWTPISRTVSGGVIRWMQVDVAWNVAASSTYTKFVMQVQNGAKWNDVRCVNVVTVSNYLYGMQDTVNVWTAGMPAVGGTIPGTARSAQLTFRVAGVNLVLKTGQAITLRLVPYNGAVAGTPSNSVVITIP
jgi:hypothetical protein